MFGHVATSIGGALPGRAGLDGLISQHISPASITAPADATHAFIEIQAPGGNTAAGNGFASAGGAANDAIVSAFAGDVFEVPASLLLPQTTASNATVRKNGATVLTARSEGPSSSSTQAGPAGKYSGGSATASNAPGRGGGRLAGPPPVTGAAASAPGVGSGRSASQSNSPALAGGVGMGCITFFRSYESALAFANSLYGGNWQP